MTSVRIRTGVFSTFVSVFSPISLSPTQDLIGLCLTKRGRNLLQGRNNTTRVQKEDLSIESTGTALQGLTNAMDSIAETARSEQQIRQRDLEIRGLETEFRMLKELGDVEEARKVLVQIKELNRLSTAARVEKMQEDIPLEIVAEGENEDESSSGDFA
jgi:hypothetical protein